MSTKVLVYWLKERMWSVVSESAVRGDDIQPGEFAQTKFQGKFYSSIIIAKDEPKAIEKAEEAFRDFLNSCLIEEAAENVCSCIIDYIKAKSPVMKAFEAKEPQPNQTAEHKLDKETQGIAQSPVVTTLSPKVPEPNQPDKHIESNQPDKHKAAQGITQSPVVTTLTSKDPEFNQEDNHKATQDIAPSNLLTKGLGLKYNRTNEAAQKEAVSVKEFRELQDQVRRLKRRIKDLESKESQPSSPKVVAAAFPSSPVQVTETVVTTDTYNGYTFDQLKNMISHLDTLFEICEKLLLSLFTRDYLITHSVTGRRANSHTEAKPKIDSRLYACFIRLVKEKLPSVKETDITTKVQAIQKKCKKMSM